MREYFVYIMASKKNGTLYIGVTNNLEGRVYDHKNKTIPGFTSKYGLSQLVYCEEYQYINDAIAREKQLKSWNRKWKIDLIEEENSKWVDLAEDWYE